MRKIVILLSLVPSVVLLAACPLMKKKGGEEDAAAEAGAVAVAEEASAPEPAAEASAPPPTAVPVTAKNAGEIARFAAETKIESQAAKILSATVARTGPRSGGNVAALKPQTDVVKVAEYKDAFLVTFADPKDSATTLMGWVNKEAFTAIADAGPDAAKPDAAVDAGPVVAKCAAGQELVVVGAGMPAVCKKKCTADKDCAKGCLVAQSASGKAVRVCAAD